MLKTKPSHGVKRTKGGLRFKKTGRLLKSICGIVRDYSSPFPLPGADFAALNGLRVDL